MISTISDDDDSNVFYKDYCYMTSDIKDTLHKYFNDELDKKKPYEELVKELSQKFNPHMNFIVQHVHKKLLSLHNSNEATSEIVEESSATDTDLSSNTQTEK